MRMHYVGYSTWQSIISECSEFVSRAEFGMVMEVSECEFLVPGTFDENGDPLIWVYAFYR